MEALPELRIDEPEAQVSSDCISNGIRLSSLVLVDAGDYKNDPFYNCDFCAFKLQELLGKGSYGDVWKAQCKNETVALKIIKSTNEVLRGVFFAEVEAMRSIDHPNIVGVMGACVQPVYAIAMEFMRCGSMDQLLHQSKHIKYKMDHVFHWAVQCAEAMFYIHHRGFAHRDLKPANLLLDEDCHLLKVADFGTAMYMSTETEHRLGSAPWMAPEVFAGLAPTAKSDYYSFGIILWEMLTRQLPYCECLSAEEILWSVQDGLRPPRIEDIPTKLMEMIESCWDASLEKRPSKQQVRKVLRILLVMYPNYNEPLTRCESKPEQEQGSSDADNGKSKNGKAEENGSAEQEVSDILPEEKELLEKKHSLIQQYVNVEKCSDLIREKNFLQRVMRKKESRRSSLNNSMVQSPRIAETVTPNGCVK